MILQPQSMTGKMLWIYRSHLSTQTAFPDSMKSRLLNFEPWLILPSDGTHSNAAKPAQYP